MYRGPPNVADSVTFSGIMFPVRRADVSPAGGAFIIYFGRFPSRRPRFVRDILSFVY